MLRVNLSDKGATPGGLDWWTTPWLDLDQDNYLVSELPGNTIIVDQTEDHDKLDPL